MGRHAGERLAEKKMSYETTRLKKKPMATNEKVLNHLDDKTQTVLSLFKNRQASGANTPQIASPAFCRDQSPSLVAQQQVLKLHLLR